MGPSASREFDVILLGATGFVGALTAQHLARHAPPTLRIGLAGRSAERLAQLRGGLEVMARDWPLIVADVTDQAAITALAARTGVLVSTVGPYLRYGLPLVRACADAGTDYADLTGETLFVRRSIDACHEAAVASGARIVHACGFDSVPSDLAVGLTAARVAADGQGQLAGTVLHVRSIRGGVSGGTFDSLREQVLEMRADPSLRAVISQALCLTDGEAPHPIRRARPARRRRRVPVWRDSASGDWQTPFVMGGFNRQIVLRSDALSGWAYGTEFRYREVVDTGSGVAGMARSAVIAGGSTAVMVGMWFGPSRRVLDVILPDPGEGPDEKTRRHGRFLMEVDAETTTGARYRTRFGAYQDPGYEGTAVMLGESALCLALDADVPDRTGVLTPMTAMGEGLAQRLRAHDFTVRTEVVTR
jgi:short subunit dehydrogenase-like uncharacterized protein